MSSSDSDDSNTARNYGNEHSADTDREEETLDYSDDSHSTSSKTSLSSEEDGSSACEGSSRTPSTSRGAHDKHDRPTSSEEDDEDDVDVDDEEYGSVQSVSRTSHDDAAIDAAVLYTPPAFRLHPWKIGSSLPRPVKCSSLTERLAEARQNAAACWQQSKGEECCHYLTRVMTLSTLVNGAEHLHTIDSQGRLADAYLQLRGCPSQAHHHAKHALKTLRNARPAESEAPDLPCLAGSAGLTLDSSNNGPAKAPGDHDDSNEQTPRHCVEFRCWLCLGRAQVKLNMWLSAVKSLQMADNIQRATVQNTGQCSIKDIVTLATARAKCHSSLKQVNEAIAVLNKAISYCDELEEISSESPALQLHFQLSSKFGGSLQVYCQADRYNDALDTLTHLRHTLSKTSPGSSQLAECEVQTARLLVENTDLDGSAEKHFKKALNILHKLHGMRHAKSLAVKDDLAKWKVLKGQYEEAAAILQDVLQKKEIVFGAHSIEVGKSQQLLGTVYLASGKLPEAEQCMTMAYDVLASLLGARNREVEQLKQTIGMIRGPRNARASQRRGRFPS